MSEINQPVNPGERLSICIVSHKAYGAMTGGNSGHIGGVEWQTSLLAKWLVQRGHQVSLLTWDEGGPPIEVIQGVRVIKVCRQNAGLPGLRFFHPKWTGLNRALRLADADVYYHNCCECVTGQVALWCARHGRKFVYSSASNVDCEASLPVLTGRMERALYRRGLRGADVRIVQTATQRSQLKKNFGLESVIIPMPCENAAMFDTKPPSSQPPPRVLWIGRVYEVKRPDRLLDLAEACPDLTFDLVGPCYSDDYTQNVVRRAKSVRNVVLHGAIPREQVSSFYRTAAFLCCTSEYEGFPNTFLEAWSHGLPIVSTFDPDSIIVTRKLGLVGRDVPELQTAVRSLYASPALYMEMSQNARRYVLENHRSDVVLPKFEQIFRNVTSGILDKRPAVPCARESYSDTL